MGCRLTTKTWFLLALCPAIVAGCSASSTLAVRLDAADPAAPTISVTGLSSGDLATLARAKLSPEAWTSVLRVSVSADAVPVAGQYTVADGAIVFRPMFPLDPGRPYQVVFDPARVPGGTLAHLSKISTVVSRPPGPATPVTNVAAVYPDAETVPANLLRMYIEFSGPMGSRGGQDYIEILDGQRRAIEGALLPLDTGLWNPERTRFTVLFDPGRVKRGILPNRVMGRPLKPGDTFTVVVRSGWPDANGLPLGSDFHREYRAGPPIERGLDTREWQISPTPAGSRDPLIVTFPAPLDHGLLQRALSISRGGAAVTGQARIQEGDKQWLFMPYDSWQPGDYVLSVLPELEDVAGNRVGHAFETLSSGRDDTHQPPARVPFRVGPAR